MRSRAQEIAIILSKYRKKMGARNGARFEVTSSGELETYMRPEELEHHEGWGLQKEYWQTKQHGIISGPIKYEDLPDEMYHTTTNLPAVLASGHLRGQHDGGGLGGGNNMPGVSFSTNKLDALLTQVTIRRAIIIAQLPMDRTGKTVKAVIDKFARIDEEEAGLPPGSLQRAAEYAMDAWHAHDDTMTTTRIGNTYSWKGPERNKTPEEIDSTYREHTHGAYKSYLQLRAECAAQALGLNYFEYKEHPSNQTLKNPVLIGDSDTFVKMKVEDVGIVTVHKDMLPKGALVRKGSDEFLSEIRVHADISLAQPFAKALKKKSK